MIGCPGGKCVGRTPALVESIDIYPTLLEEAGITVPSCPTNMAASRKVQPTPLNGRGRVVENITTTGGILGRDNMLGGG